MSVDISLTVAPKSDQLNADDLIVGSKTIKITGVRGADTPDQPVAINFEGDGGKPYKPCKSMRRVLLHCWGKDGQSYVGRSLTLYCDPKVKFGGLEVGGIRISHMSHIPAPITMALTASKANRKPYTVQPLKVADPAPVDLDALKSSAAEAALSGSSGLTAWWGTLNAEEKKAVKPHMEEHKNKAAEVDALNQPLIGE
jgi:hypothetical protein